jgi:hypothetical protein
MAGKKMDRINRIFRTNRIFSQESSGGGCAKVL